MRGVEMNNMKIKDCKIIGALKLEFSVVKILAVVSVMFFSLSILIEYVFPIFIENSLLVKMHHQFIVNVLLGIAGSSSISFLCLFIPFLSKKQNQQTKLILQVKEVFLIYAKIYQIIKSECQKSDNEILSTTEYSLLSFSEKLKESSKSLIDMYNEFDICSKSIEKIIECIETSFFPLVEIVGIFSEIVLSNKDGKKDESVFVGLTGDLEKEKRIMLFQQLLCSLESIKSYSEVIALSSAYIKIENLNFEVLRDDSKKILDGMKKIIFEQKNYNKKMEFLSRIQEINMDFSRKENEIYSDFLEKQIKEQKLCQQKKT